ncbi:biotin--[acetyl-CoA-carboxylase] ligase [Amniculibacterium aquaticum]|uniref:biotin--[acetyl-CoA-carboxylase] ligase n=1 Tax=Amniculibacterium aquaticum TaxID=2479858 RepID=UPI000F5A1D70|nr:biotin--[acetyl-CoA-carboxylase] ligase [Amniculibacterium aquaticum]
MNPLIQLDQCESTQNEILNYLPVHPDGILAVFTDKQTKGRGQYGNQWDSGEGMNMAYSIAVRCQDYKASALSFNFHTAVLCRYFLDKLTDAKVKIKWPNDIIINNKKVAGLLVEKMKCQGVEYYVFGIGLNLLQVDFLGLSSAGSVLSQTGIRFRVDDFAKEFHDFLCGNVLQCDEAEVLELYNLNLFRKNEISVFEIKGMRQNGIIRLVDAQGFLHVELENEGLKTFTYKELKLLY